MSQLAFRFVMSWGLVTALGLLGSSSAAARELVVAAAASLREPVTEIARVYEESHPGDRIRLTFGASSALGAQIRAGAPVDVFLSADTRIVTDLVERQIIPPSARFGFARNRLAVIARLDSALSREPLDETRPLFGLEVDRFAIPGDPVPLGRYAREWLEQRGWLEALDGRLALTEHARATLAAVEFGAADLAIVYATDAARSESVVVVYEIPDTEQPIITYAGAALRPEAAREFLEVLRDDDARRILRDAGFSPIAPTLDELQPSSDPDAQR